MTETQRVIALLKADKKDIEIVKKRLEKEQTDQLLNPLILYLRNPRNTKDSKQYKCRYGIVRNEMVLTNGSSIFVLYRTFDFKKQITRLEECCLPAVVETEEFLQDTLFKKGNSFSWNFEMHFWEEFTATRSEMSITTRGFTYSFYIGEMKHLQRILGEDSRLFLSKEAPMILAQSSIGRAYILGRKI